MRSEAEATRKEAPPGHDLITRMDHEAIVSGLRAELALFRSKHTDRATLLALLRAIVEADALPWHVGDTPDADLIHARECAIDGAIAAARQVVQP